MSALAAPRSLPLRWSAALTALLVLVPAGVLLRWPRPRAEGLERLLSQSALLQSFPATPQRPVPALWTQRLGEPLARTVWSRQSRVWWQFWGRDGDGGAFLAFPAQDLPSALPAHALRVDDLLVVAPDPLSQRLLQDQLKLAQRQRRGLEQRCLQRLQQEQAVFWSPLGLGVMAGPMAPLLQRFQEGCLSLRLQGTSLQLSGEASAAGGFLADPVPRAEVALPAPLAQDLLLEWRGPALEGLLQGLLNRQLIRDPLAARYGIGEGQLALVRRAPFVLQLRSLAQGPFQAGLALQVGVNGDRRPWNRLLDGLKAPLEAQGLEATPGGSTALPALRWSRNDGQVVGGWRWVLPRSAAPQLLVYLGPEPTGSVSTSTPLQVGGFESQLRVRPAALAAAGLLPPDTPLLVQQASQLSLVASSSALGKRVLGSPLSQLTGTLQVQPRLPAR